MSYLKFVDTDKIITRFVNLRTKQERTVIVQTAIDGTEYLTRFGKPVTSYELELYVDEKGKEAVLSAADDLSQLEVSVTLGRFYGRIKEVGEFEKLVTGWYKTMVTLSSQSEVGIR